ncbi:MAG: hypothetical protein ABSB79_07270 [Syntrophales bacterium]|jgi:phage regulator Rha-like protein
MKEMEERNMKEAKKATVRLRKEIKERKEQKPEEKKRVYMGVSVDEQLWRKLRALAVKQKKLTGDLLDKAIEKFLPKNE